MFIVYSDTFLIFLPLNLHWSCGCQTAFFLRKVYSDFVVAKNF